ncbi:MAG: patatin-like phospholipase family protein, partial [Oscillospiraceae bacterium]
MGKKALVLGGGGAKGSYEIGAWKAFEELNKSWDMIVGTSIGSLNGAAMVQGDFKSALRLWENIDYKNVFGDN